MAGRKTPRMRGETGMTVTGMRVLMIAILACTLCLGLGCGKKKDESKTEKISNVKVWTTQKKSVRPYIETIGSLSPNDEVIISAETDGIIKEIKVDEGSVVAAGTLLMKIDDTDNTLVVANAEAALRQAEANLDNLKTEHRRKEALLKEELVTLQQFDDITTRLTIAMRDKDRAKVALSLAKERLGKTMISSPLRGIVKEKKVTTGDFARTAMPLMTIVQTNPLKLSFTVTEKDASAIKTGQDVIFSVDTYPGREFYGKLTIIYPSLDERTRSLKAEAVVDNKDLELKPGFFAKVRIFTGQSKEAVVVPATSILYEGTSVRVFMQDKDKARTKFIKTGNKYGDMVEVTEGLQEGETLIVVGQNNLTDGVKINVVK